MNALITGGAGFIGSHLSEHLLNSGWSVTAIDNFDSFYDPSIKRRNVAPLRSHRAYRLIEHDICTVLDIVEDVSAPDVIIHLAAKAGVRDSIADPASYSKVNVDGTVQVLELARILNVKQFVFASSSSVYGDNAHVPWQEDKSELVPISPYAATKIAGELLGSVYSRLYHIRFLALRLFSVFGPIQCYGNGSTRRDYTYIADVVNAFSAAIAYSASDYEIINVGTNRSVSLQDLVKALEIALGKTAAIESAAAQPGDAQVTLANIEKAYGLIGYVPTVSLQAGISQFVDWMKAFG